MRHTKYFFPFGDILCMYVFFLQRRELSPCHIISAVYRPIQHAGHYLYNTRTGFGCRAGEKKTVIRWKENPQNWCVALAFYRLLWPSFRTQTAVSIFLFFNMHCHCSRNFHFPFLLATAGERRQIFGQKRNCTAAKRFLRLRASLAFF